MRSDPILREVHRMKDQFARQFDYNADKIFEHLREQAKKHPERMARVLPTTSPLDTRRTVKRKIGE